MRRISDFNQVRWTVGALGLLLVVASGCGDGDGKGAGSSGVPGTTRAADITDDEAMKLCMWVEDQDVEPSDEQACTLLGQSLAGTEAECKTFVTQCLAQPDEEPTPDDAEDSCANASKDDIGGATCTATVSEIETCYRDAVSQQKAAFEDASCANAGKGNEGETPASCKKIETTCPGLFSGGGDQDDGGGSDDSNGSSGGSDDSNGSSGGSDDSNGSSGGSDDSNGSVDESEFSCDGGATTYSADDECDGIDDCADGADEAGC